MTSSRSGVGASVVLGGAEAAFKEEMELLNAQQQQQQQLRVNMGNGTLTSRSSLGGDGHGTLVSRRSVASSAAAPNLDGMSAATGAGEAEEADSVRNRQQR